MCSYNGMKRYGWHYYMAFKWVHFRARSLHQQHWREETRALWQFCCLLRAIGHSKTCLILYISQEGKTRHREGFWPALSAFSQAENKPWDASILSTSGKQKLFFWVDSCLPSYRKLCVSLFCVELRVGDFHKIQSSIDSHPFLYGSPTVLSALLSHSLPPFSRQQCWSLSSRLSCCTLIFNRPLLLLHLVCGLWTLCGSAAGNSEWVGNLKQKRLCISTRLRFELCSALDTCSWFSGLWFKCRFAGVSVKLKSVLRNW